MNSDRKLRLGVAGLGRAFTLMAPAFAHPKITITAAADPRADARARFAAEFGAPAYETVAELCTDAGVEAIYIATPHERHAEHCRLAAMNGKHVLVEKPMALTASDCQSMIDATTRGGVALVVGHSHSFDLPVVKTRELIASGSFGSVRMITSINFTDFVYRPRRPEELHSDSGGVLFNQAPHQVDVARFLAGSEVTSVRAMSGAWDNSRPIEGAYSCVLSFASGAFASLTYSGYGHFDTDELMGWVAESGAAKDRAAHGAARALLRNARTPAEEAALKNSRNYGAKPAAQHGGKQHQHFGVVIASCEYADLRPMPGGIDICADDRRSFEPLPPPQTYRAEVMDELYAAAIEGKPAMHDGKWGMATIKVCAAMLRSARENREISLAGT